MKVQCPNCKKLTHNTTDAYDPDVRPTRAMVELLEPFKSWGWGDGFNDLECPACESPLAPSGRLRVVADSHGSDIVGMFNLVITKAKLTDNRDVYELPPDVVRRAEKADKIIELIKDDLLGLTVSKSEQIRDLLTNSDMTLKKIAEMVGTSPQYVSNVASKARREEANAKP